jgi:hypothetical protein
MYVMLPVSWFKHPFLKNEFIIKSQHQLDKIIGHGIAEIVIETSKEQLLNHFHPVLFEKFVLLFTQ